MTPNLWFWTGALVLACGAFATAWRGVLEIRRGNLASHRRLMIRSAALIGLFVAVYLGKVIVLGRENIKKWPAVDVSVLRVHEISVGLFLISGIVAYLFSRSALPAPGQSGIGAESRESLMHRRAGKATLYLFAMLIVTASAVYATMVIRAMPAGLRVEAAR